MKTVVDYVAEYISRLPEDNQVHVAFRDRLYYDRDESDERNNIWLYRFPHSEGETGMDLMGDVADISYTDKEGLCIRPIGGGRPDPYSEKNSPSFLIHCRHSAPGIAFQCSMAIMQELSNNARVFPQNGTVRCLSSQPEIVWSNTQGAYCTQAVFRCIAATTII